MGSSTENSAYGPTHNPWDPTPRPGRLGRRLGRRGRRRASRRGRSARTRAARSSCRPRSAATSACGRPTAPSRATASSRSPRASTRSARSARNVRDNALLYRIISGRDENDSTTVDVPPVELPEGDDLKGVRIGVPRAAERGRGDRAGREGGRRRGDRARRALGAELEQCELPLSVDYGLACYYLIAPAEASAEPRALRRRPLRPPRRRRRLPRDGDAHPPRRLRRRAQAPDHARHLRAVVRLLRRVLRHGAEGAHA